jgi:hypothetical protein
MYANHESFDGAMLPSRRDGRSDFASAEWVHGTATPWAARLEWRDERVARVTQAATEQRWRSTSLWGAARGEQRLGGGWIEAALGAGRHDAVDRTELAPSLGYRHGWGTLDGAVVVSRVLAPVWSDLAPSQAPFLQSTWNAGLEAGWTGPQAGQARLHWTMGRTRDRAVVARLPLEELWLRSGFTADPGGHDFGLLYGFARWETRLWAAGAEGFLLARDHSGVQPAVDPDRGGRGFLEGRGRFFAGDLGVRVRAEAEVVGPRESQALVPNRLSGYVTFGATAVLTLADLTVTVRARNLEDRRRPQVWVDPVTGSEALGPEREFRLCVNWRLFD